MPGLPDVFRKIVRGRLSASGLYRAIRDGRGGKPLIQAYCEAEAIQASEGRIPRRPLFSRLPLVDSKPVDMFNEKDVDIRFAFIESEMMSRGERGEWALKIRFSERLSRVPIIVLQGRYDQVCSRDIAMSVFNAWPCKSKLLVPVNGGHWSYGGPDKQTFTAAGFTLTEVQEASVNKAMSLHFGNHRILIGASIDCLTDSPQQTQTEISGHVLSIRSSDRSRELPKTLANSVGIN